MTQLDSSVILGDDDRWYIVFEGVRMRTAFDSKSEALTCLSQMEEIDSRLTMKEGQQQLLD